VQSISPILPVPGVGCILFRLFRLADMQFRATVDGGMALTRLRFRKQLWGCFALRNIY